MKPVRIITLAVVILFTFSSCRVWNSIFQPKYGCPSNGKNVGAEKLVSGDPSAEKAARKAKKFKS